MDGVHADGDSGGDDQEQNVAHGYMLMEFHVYGGH